MRNVLDRKRFYKSSDYKKGQLPDRVQVGTVIEGPTEYYSGRLTRKERYALACVDRAHSLVPTFSLLSLWIFLTFWPSSACHPLACRKQNMVAELLADEDTRKYAKRKFLEVQHESQRGGKHARKMKSRSSKPKWSLARH